MEEHEVFGAIGSAGFERLVSAFYRQVPMDEILGPMYPAGDLAGAETRLRGFLIYRFGGPQDYIEQRGHPRLRMRHVRFEIGVEARNRWMQLMMIAMDEAALPEEPARILREFFSSTATFLINSPGAH